MLYAELSHIPLEASIEARIFVFGISWFGEKNPNYHFFYTKY